MTTRSMHVLSAVLAAAPALVRAHGLRATANATGTCACTSSATTGEDGFDVYNGFGETVYYSVSEPEGATPAVHGSVAPGGLTTVVKGEGLPTVGGAVKLWVHREEGDLDRTTGDCAKCLYVHQLMHNPWLHWYHSPIVFGARAGSVCAYSPQSGPQGTAPNCAMEFPAQFPDSKGCKGCFGFYKGGSGCNISIAGPGDLHATYAFRPPCSNKSGPINDYVIDYTYRCDFDTPVIFSVPTTTRLAGESRSCSRAVKWAQGGRRCKGDACIPGTFTNPVLNILSAGCAQQCPTDDARAPWPGLPTV